MYHKDLLPLNYPWATELKSVLVTEDREYPLGMSGELGLSNTFLTLDDGVQYGLDEYLSQKGLPTLDERIPLVAVGSNSSPLALRSKVKRYGRLRTSQVIPVLTAKMKNLGLGYSAHLVSGGYVPAAPFRAEGEEAHVTVSFLTVEQLRAIDATEPTYERVALSHETYPLTLENGTVLDVSYLYTSRFGVLRGATESPIPLGTQADLYRTLQENGVGEGFFEGSPQEVSDRIAGKKSKKARTASWTQLFGDIKMSDRIVSDRPDVDPINEFEYEFAEEDAEMYSRWYGTPSGREYMSDTVRDYLNDRALGEYGEYGAGDDFGYDDAEHYASLDKVYRNDSYTKSWNIPMSEDRFYDDPWTNDSGYEEIMMSNSEVEELIREADELEASNSF